MILQGLWDLLQTYITRHKDYKGPRYCEVYDALFNRITMKWLENKCSDQRCSYCRERPEKHPKGCECGQEGSDP